MCAIMGCAAQVCLLASVLCESPAIVCPFPMSTAGGLLLWVVWRGENSQSSLKITRLDQVAFQVRVRNIRNKTRE